jgi:NADH-quinone oxidoreductase subunit E
MSWQMWTDRETMLSDAERREIETEIEEYGQKHSVCIEAMKIVQRHRGWVPDETIKDIGAMIGMTTAELDAVATFYSLIFRKPVGEHVILICDSVSCWIMGYEKVLAYLKTKLGVELGGTSSDGKFTLLPVACIGACHNAPAMIIDKKLYGNLDEQRIDEILAEYGSRLR